MKRSRELDDPGAPAARSCAVPAGPSGACDEYAGWRPTAGETVERVAAASLTPQSFFTRFVACRRPVILVGDATAGGWVAPPGWGDPELRTAAGSSLVRVEQRPSAAAAFGVGAPRETLSLREVLDRLGAGEERLYLTTEAAAMDAHGRLAVLTSPLTHMVDCLTLRPPLAGRLVPAAFNLWLGRASAGASSGLHHDYHDSLYTLLAGRKRFALYAPCDTCHLYPHDGADAEDVARVAALDLKAASLALGLAEAQGLASITADRRLEAALDASLPPDADGDWAGRDDYEDSGAESEERSDDEAPPHFSRADVTRHHDFPLLSRATRLEVELAPGEVLFMPAGWWHDVTSYSDGGEAHSAVNAWFHPPDAASFDAPYSDGLWERDWAHWQRDILPTLGAVL